MKKKLPPFGAALANRLRFNNRPFLVRVCVGATAWADAKRVNEIGNSSALVVPPGENPAGFDWQLLRDQVVVIDWSTGPKAEFIRALVNSILPHSPSHVIVNPLFVDYSKPAYEYDLSKPLGSRLVQVRETVHIISLNNKMEAAA